MARDTDKHIPNPGSRPSLSRALSLSLSHLPAPLAVDGVFRGPFFSFALLLVFYNGVLVLCLSYSPTMVPWRLKSFFLGGFP